MVPIMAPAEVPYIDIILKSIYRLNNIYMNYLIDTLLGKREYKQHKQHKQHIVLLGDGFFARGFLNNINYGKFNITQIYKDTFINPQDLMYSLQRNKKYKEFYRKGK